MKSLLDEKPYTLQDKDEIISELIKYISTNNTYEHDLINPGKAFVSAPYSIPEDVMKASINTSFLGRLVDAGNVLKYQSIFISNYMTHIGRYLHHAGIRYYFSYFKPSDLVNCEFNRKMISGATIEDIITDMMSSGNDYKCNPFNIFYNLYIVITTDNAEFVKDMDKLTGINSRYSADGGKRQVVISVLPAINLNFINQIVKLIHKHF